MYGDRNFSDSTTKAKGDTAMKLEKLSIKEKLRNKRISKKRSEGEHPYETIQYSINGGKTKLTTIAQEFMCNNPLYVLNTTLED